MKTDAVAHIEGNIQSLVAPLAAGQGFQVAAKIEALLGNYISLAGQTALIAAWDNLTASGVIRARDKSQTKNLWKLFIVKQ